MTVEDLYQWLMSNNQLWLARKVNEAAGKYADAKADAESSEKELEHGSQMDFEDTPEAAGG